MTRPLLKSSVFLCLGTAATLWRRASAEEIQTAVDAIPDRCAQPDACTHGSCQRVARDYLAGMSARARALAKMKEFRAP